MWVENIKTGKRYWLMLFANCEDRLVNVCIYFEEEDRDNFLSMEIARFEREFKKVETSWP